MNKALLIISLFFIFSNLSSQDIDSSYIDDDFIKDTTAIWHIGFSVGGIAQSLLYSANNEALVADSISISAGKPNTGFAFGLIVERDFSDKLWLRTGLNINISKMNINYIYKEKPIDYNFNYSTLELPLWLQYAFKTKQRGWSWGAGIKPSLDITHAVDYNNRLFDIRKTTILVGTGPSRRWQLNSGRWVNISLAINIGIFNIFKETNNIYNNSISGGRPWQLQMLLSLN